MHLWRTQLDPDNRQEVSESKFFKFMRENKIVTEKKQLDDMFKQCLFVLKGTEVSVGSTIQLNMYQRLFQKPLLLIGAENALALIEEHPPKD